MTAELRKTGISVVGDIPWGTHFCVFYETRQDLLDILIPYFKAGLENNEFCLWVISISELLTEEEAYAELRKALPDLDRYLAERSIEIVSHQEWFLKGGAFDLHRVADQFKEKVDDALARGYAGMRINGSPAWLEDADSTLLRAFEEELDTLFPNQRVTASCTYPLARVSGDVVFDVARTHQFAIARRQGEWEVIETPEQIQAKAEIERVNDELEQRVAERTKELAKTNLELKSEIGERMRAEEQLKATSEQLRALSASLQSAREEEATRIAREIHDELGSSLTRLKWDLELMAKEHLQTEGGADLSTLRENISAMIVLIDDTVDVVRRISAELRPSVLDDLGLVAAIRWHTRQFQERTGILSEFDSPIENLDLSREQSTAVFRIFEEALTNVLRHAQATRVDVKLGKGKGDLIVTIRDNGRGITVDEKSDRLSLGLVGMRERVNLIAGEVDIRGSEGKGTVVTVRIPVA